MSSSVTLADRLKNLDKAEEQVVLIAEETSNLVQILSQSANADNPNNGRKISTVSECNASLAKFSAAVKSFEELVSGELNYLQKYSASHPHESSVYLNAMKLDLAHEKLKVKNHQLKNLTDSNL